MGNQLVLSGAAVDVNIADISDSLTMKAPLGRRKGRLFKALHCGTDDGMDIVAKVFRKAVGDTEQARTLKYHKERLDSYQQTLLQYRQANPTVPWNIAYYSRMIGGEGPTGACCLMRPYFNTSLTERLLTRPFLSQEQKLFVVYQLLQGVALMSKLKVPHGDIKTENVMITATGWVYLTDFAPFKPTFIPANNPADFTYYYDTTEQRVCFLAPERFFDPEVDGVPSNYYLNPTEAMDVFSIGCIAAHILTEDPLLYLPDVLALRRNELNISEHLEKRGITDSNLLKWLSEMLARDPTKRPTAQECISRNTPSVFPHHFGYLYEKVLSPLKQAPPDIQLTSLWSCAKSQIQIARGDLTGTEAHRAVGCFANVLSPLVCVALRYVKLRESRVRGICLMDLWSGYCSDDTRLFVYVPHCIAMFRDSFAHVRAEAVKCLASIGSRVGNPPPSASKLYEEYIFPELYGLRKDESVLVRAAMAEVLAEISGTARRFLERRFTAGGAMAQQESYDFQLQQLRQTVWNFAMELLNDDDVSVAAAMLSCVSTLAATLGRDSTLQLLIPMLTTFLTKPATLRKCLFGEMCKLFVYVGPLQLEGVVLPLIQGHGISDNDTSIVVEAVRGVTMLAKLGTLTTPSVRELTKQITPLTMHPNRLVRQAAIQFLTDVPCTVDSVDIVTFIMPIVTPYLEFYVRDLRHLPKLPALRDPMPREAFLAICLNAEKMRLYSSEPWFPLVKAFLEVATHRTRASTVVREGPLVNVVYPLRIVRTDSRVKEVLWESDFFPEGLVNILKEVYIPNTRQTKRLQFLEKQLSASSIPVVPAVMRERGASEMKSPQVGPIRPIGRTVSLDSFHPVGGLWCQSNLHCGPIYSMASYDNSFVSASGDGTLKVWNVVDVLKQYCLIPKQTFNFGADSKVLSTCYVGDSGDTVCGGTSRGDFKVLNVETGNVTFSTSSDTLKTGAITCVTTMPSSNWVFQGTQSGHVIAVDVRQRTPVWTTQLHKEQGALTHLLLGVGAKKDCHWMVGGTLNGYVALWDLRYRLNVFSVLIPRPNPTITAMAVQGNQPQVLLCPGSAEILKLNLEGYTPDMETRDVQAVSSMITESYRPAVPKAMQKEKQSPPIRSILQLPEPSKAFLSAGNDRRIRFWDSAEINNSYIISGRDTREVQPRYVRTMSSTTSIIKEELLSGAATSKVPKGLLDRQTEHSVHQDAVTCLQYVGCRDVPVVISGSRDGMLKLWSIKTQLPALI
eukprot:PhF_6_TR36381/c2_g1_i2/m.53462/K08333/PIK3R4, VPS15; phosphoinositide-3-kinase, regulatory subunit 4